MKAFILACVIIASLFANIATAASAEYLYRYNGQVFHTLAQLEAHLSTIYGKPVTIAKITRWNNIDYDDNHEMVELRFEFPSEYVGERYFVCGTTNDPMRVCSTEQQHIDSWIEQQALESNSWCIPGSLEVHPLPQWKYKWAGYAGGGGLGGPAVKFDRTMSGTLHGGEWVYTASPPSCRPATYARSHYAQKHVHYSCGDYGVFFPNNPQSYDDAIRCYTNVRDVERLSCRYPFSPLNDFSCATTCAESQPSLVGNQFCVGPEAAAQRQCTAGNPITIADGKKMQVEPVDIGSNGLSVSRVYSTETERSSDLIVRPLPVERAMPRAVRYIQPRSYRGATGFVSSPAVINAEGAVSLLGEWRLRELPSLTLGTAIMIRNDGERRESFKAINSSLYMSREFTGNAIIATTSGWKYQPQPGITEHYNRSGLMTSRTQAGTTLSVVYNTNNQPERLSIGLEQLTLVYDDARRLSRAELGSEWVNYGYDERNRLVSVTRSDDRVRQYHYEDPRFPEALTGITDERGVRYATFQYDAQGRAIESRHGEQDRYQFVFGDNQTTVINPLGKETIYRYTSLSGIKRLTAVEGVPSENCAGANKAYSYYPNGQLQTRTDWQGVVTRFEYNSRGLVSREIEAEGTPLQRETRYEYHPVHPWPIRITSGLNITEYDYDDHGNLRASRVLPR